MAYNEKSYVSKILRTRPAQYRDYIKKKEFLLFDRQELSANTSKGIFKKKIYYEKLDLNHYPQINKFYDFLAKFINVNKKEILISEGRTGE